MAIIDAFMFFNELDLLEIRLHELCDVVDYFVLVEATKTHTGKFKPCYYWENKDRFWEFQDKIIYICVEDMPITKGEIDAVLTSQDRHWIESKYQAEDNWVRERFQRNAMMRELQYADPEDVVIISDADEIVRASSLQEALPNLCEGSNAVEQTLNTYYINWQCTNMPWWGSKIIRRKFLVGDTTPSEVRFHTKACKYIYNGGWHFGFLGGAEGVKLKIESYAHQEFNIPEVLNAVESRLSHKNDALGRLYEYKVVPINEHFPKYLRDNLDKFDWMIYK